MKRFAPALILSLLVPCTPAVADEAAPFVTGHFATSQKACKRSADTPPDDELTLDRNGIFGYESGCSFVTFHRETMNNSDEVFSYIAVASCGDDSGITRPDLITIIPENDGESLRVQSQNEYVLELASVFLSPPSDGTQERINFNYISRTYIRCH